MKTINTLIFLAGAYVVFGANGTDDVHISNIERAITGIPAVLSNSLGTVRYDFTAILREIKTVPMPKEWRDASARMGYKRWLQSHIRFYEKDNFDALKFKIDYESLPTKEKQSLMAKVRKELGRYPKWYQPEKAKKLKAIGAPVKDD